MQDEQQSLTLGVAFQDCSETVAVPAGSYRMGLRDGRPRERPVHEVTIGAPLGVGRCDVTFAEWVRLCAGRGLSAGRWHRERRTPGARPASGDLGELGRR